jgi:Reverse transcriptase (RNA-dependent DNA polymerase).
LPLTWVFTYKFDSNGLLVKHKARICVRGDLQKMSTEEKYSATLAVRTARAIFALAAAFDLDTAQFDAVNAFLNSLLDEEVYVEMPPGLFPASRRIRCWKLLRALYGLRKSPRLWQQEASRVLKSLGFKVVQEDICLFVARRYHYHLLR